MVKNYTYEYTIGANANLDVTGTNLEVSTPSGYAPIAFRQINTANGNVVWRSIIANSTGNSPVVRLRNLSTSSITARLNLDIIYVKASRLQ